VSSSHYSESAAFGELAAAERRLVQAESNSSLARQAALTDSSLEAFRPEAEVLDRFNPEPDAARLANI
jgi:hypothetical protein